MQKFAEYGQLLVLVYEFLTFLDVASVHVRWIHNNYCGVWSVFSTCYSTSIFINLLVQIVQTLFTNSCIHLYSQIVQIPSTNSQSILYRWWYNLFGDGKTVPLLSTFGSLNSTLPFSKTVMVPLLSSLSSFSVDKWAPCLNWHLHFAHSPISVSYTHLTLPTKRIV